MPNIQPMRHTRFLLGSIVEMMAHAPPKLAERAVAEAFAALSHIHQQMNFHDAESDISRINLYAWKRPVSVSIQPPHLEP